MITPTPKKIDQKVIFEILNEVMNSIPEGWKSFQSNNIFWYRDNSNPSSRIQKKMLTFSFGLWGEKTVAHKNLLNELNFMHRLHTAYNDLHDNEINYHSEPESGATTRLVINYYPPGGFVDYHVDKEWAQNRYVPLLLLSQYGWNYSGGGLYLSLDEIPGHIESNLKVGDIIKLDQGVYHGVSEIKFEPPPGLNNKDFSDPFKDLTFDKNHMGRVICVLVREKTN